MALLLEDVRLRLPLPHQQLAVFGRPKCEPLARLVDRHDIDVALRDTEQSRSVTANMEGSARIPQKMNHVELRQVIKSEKAVGEAHHQQIGLSMKRCTVDLGIVLHEEVLLGNPPTGLCNILLRLWIFLRHVLPTEEGPILADSIDLFNLG